MKIHTRKWLIGGLRALCPLLPLWLTHLCKVWLALLGRMSAQAWGFSLCLSPPHPRGRDSPWGARSPCLSAELGSFQRTFLRGISSEPRQKPGAESWEGLGSSSLTQVTDSPGFCQWAAYRLGAGSPGLWEMGKDGVVSCCGRREMLVKLVEQPPA